MDEINGSLIIIPPDEQTRFVWTESAWTPLLPRVVTVEAVDRRRAIVSIRFELAYRIGAVLMPGDKARVSWSTGIVHSRCDPTDGEEAERAR